MVPEPTDPPERERRRNEILAACLDDARLAAEVADFLNDQAHLDRLAVPRRTDQPYGLC
jgi:hypothetical protein